jgi:hypothetical protein
MSKKSIAVFSVGVADPTQGGTGIFNQIVCSTLLDRGYEVHGFFRVTEGFVAEHFNQKYHQALIDKGLQSHLVYEKNDFSGFSFGYAFLEKAHEYRASREAVHQYESIIKNASACISIEMGWAVALANVKVPVVCVLGDPISQRLAHITKINWLQPKSIYKWLQVQTLRFTNAKIKRDLGDHIIVTMASPKQCQDYLGYGINCQQFRWFSPQVQYVPKTLGAVKSKMVCLHVGSLYTSASRSMLEYWERELCPELAKLPIEFELRFVGKLPPEISEWKSMHENVKFVFVGHLENTDEEFRNADVFFSPMQYPIGIRTRIISAASYGITIIADESAHLGLPEFKNGQDAFFTSTAQQTAEVLMRLANSPSLLLETALNARARWEQSFHPEKNMDHLLKLVGL